MPAVSGKRGHSVSQLCQSLFQDTTLCADIHAHKAMPWAACRDPVESLSAKEYLAVVKSQAGLIDKETEETVVVKPQRSAVEPYEERGLGSQRPYLWDILSEEANDEIDIPLNITEHLSPPLLALTEGRDSGNGCEERRLVKLICL